MLRSPPRPRVTAPLLLAALACAAAALARAAPPDPAEVVRRRRGDLVVVERAPATAPAETLLLAAELTRCGRGLQAELFARGWSTGPAMRAATSDGAGRTARALAAAAILRGDGLPVAFSRWIDLEHARLRAGGDRGLPELPRELYDRRLAALARAAGLQGGAPRDLRPVWAEAGPGGRLRAEALGWGLLAAARLAADLAGARRIVAGFPYVGATAEEGFEGLALMTAAAAKLEALRRQLAFDGKELGEAPIFDVAVETGEPGRPREHGYDPFARPRWFPHEIEVANPGEAAAAGAAPALSVADGRSRLRDQAAILLGACAFARLAREEAGPGTASLFGPLREAGGVTEEIFPQALAGLASDLARFVFRNIAALHFDPAPGRQSFVAEWEAGKRGARVEVADAALAMLALEAVVDLLADETKLRAEARKLIQSQAAALLARQTTDGAVPQAYSLAPGPAPAEDATLATEAAAIQAFLAAARVTGEEKYRVAAEGLARSVEARRYDPWVSLYLGPEPEAEAAIAPADAALVLGALRDLGLDGGSPGAIDRLREVYQALARAGAFGAGDGASGAGAATLRLKVAR